MPASPPIERTRAGTGSGAETNAARSRSTTFAPNLGLPVHRWFRYPAGFAATWAQELILRERARGRARVLDPFCGTATVLLEASRAGLASYGLEPHPFVRRVARAKLTWPADPAALLALARLLAERAAGIAPDTSRYPELVHRCFTAPALDRLDRLRRALEEDSSTSPGRELCWLALVAILRDAASVGTAPWQYVLPARTRLRRSDPHAAFLARAGQMAADMTAWRREVQGGQAGEAVLLASDARTCEGVPEAWADLVITSPPYANNFDYADATRLEMTFLGELEGWSDLQHQVRRHLLRSCTQHVGGAIAQAEAALEDPLLAPIAGELRTCHRALVAERERHAGRKPYHAMVALYFLDLARTWIALRRVTIADALVCFVVGDSAPYGVHLPVERWLGELAMAAGFRGFRFEQTRERNRKWKNRKHRVPLQEGRLWVW